MSLPREKGSSPHNPLAVDCLQRGINEPFQENQVCAVCMGAVRNQARYFLDLSSRELGT